MHALIKLTLLKDGNGKLADLNNLLTFEKPLAQFYCCSISPQQFRRCSNKIARIFNIVRGGELILYCCP